MGIGARIFLALAGPTIIVIAVFAFLDQQRSRKLLRQELVREGRAIVRTFQLAAEDALRDRQLEDLRELVDQITGYERVLGVRVFDRSGGLNYQSAVLDDHPFMQHEELRRVLRERRSLEARRVIRQEPVLTFLAPLSGPAGEPAGAVQILQLESFIDEDARASRNFIGVLALVVIVVTGGILLLVTRVIVGWPVAELVRRLGVIGSGDLRTVAPASGSREFDQIARELNKMCERLDRAQRDLLMEHAHRLRTEDRLRRMSQLTALGRLAGGLAHEIGTPLNVIGGRAESLIRKLPGNEPAQTHLRIITAQIARIERTVRAVLDLSRGRHPHLIAVDVKAIVHRVLEFLEHRLAETGIVVESAMPEGLPGTLGDPDQLHQVFLNLVVNAIDAMPSGGVVRIRGEVVEQQHALEDGGARFLLAVSVEDTGEGIPERDMEKVFEPFFTTKEVGKGTGLGLAVSYSLVVAHGGWIQVESEPGRGARFTVYLPSDTDDGQSPWTGARG